MIHNKIQTEIIETIEQLANHTVETARFNTTKFGHVISDLDNNKYVVKINNADVTVPAIVGDSYSINDTVVIMVPNNNEVKQFILGKIKY